MAAAAIFDFPPCLLVCVLPSVPNFVQISRIIAENDLFTFVADVRQMTSRKLTTGFVFENPSQYFSRGYGYTCHGKIWRKSELLRNSVWF